MEPNEKDSIAKAPSGRVSRTPVGQRNILTIKGKDENFVYRVVNDIDDRVAQFQEAGYELVPDESVKVGDKRVNAATSVGSYKQLSVGQGTKAMVMRIRKDWYEEDQAKKLAHVAAVEDATREKALNGTYGDIKVSRD